MSVVGTLANSPAAASSATAEAIPRHLPLPSRVIVRGIDAKLLPVVQELREALGLSAVTARLLVARGITTVTGARAFLFPTLREHLPDPHGVKNILPAAGLICDAIEQRKQITIYSDFDVDGLSAGSQLELFLEALGARVNHYTPNRFTEGYGLVPTAVEKLARAGTELLITVDCGITNVREIALAKRHGMATVVIDHHQPHELPPADVIVNPAQEGCPFRDHLLCAAGLVWMLLVVLRSAAHQRWGGNEGAGRTIPDPKDFLDLAALGTICDMVPLVGLNRVLAYRGLEALQTTKRPGLIALKNVSGIGEGKKVTAGHVSFGIGPRINAAGRLDDARLVFELLTTTSSNRAKTLAERINRLNQERKGVEEEVRLACLEMVASDPRWQSRSALALFADSFHPGVIGIVAQRLVEQYYKPVAVMAPGEVTQGNETLAVIKGSVRSIAGFHVADALQELDDVLMKHGGHAQAGGFTLEYDKLESFQERFAALAESRLTADQRIRERLADAEVSLEEISYQVVEEFGRLAPFGMGNPSPLLVTYDVTVESVQTLADGHLRLRFSDGRHFVGAVAWRFRGHPLLLKGKRVNIAYQPELNSYQGLSSVQLSIKEVWA